MEWRMKVILGCNRVICHRNYRINLVTLHKYQRQMQLGISVRNLMKLPLTVHISWMFGCYSQGNLSVATLTHLPLVPHMCISEQGQDWFRQWLVACSAPSHYLNQCWLIVNWTIRNKTSVKFEWKQNTFYSRKCIWNCRLPKWQPFYPGGDE